MKKISFILASVALLGSAALTGCVQDTQPRISDPTEFVLNTPALSDNVYILNSASTVNLTWSQPNYGLGLVPNYYVMLSQYPEFKDANGEDSYTEINTIYTSASVDISGADLAAALQNMYGWESEADVPTTPVDIYVRVRSEIPNYEAGTILSNIIPLSCVSYFVVTGPDEIWLIGQPEGWNIASADGWELYETEQGSKIYKGAFDIPAGEFQFRFYDKLGDWEHYSIGSQDEDASIEISMSSGKYNGECFYDPDTDAAGKGSWQDPNWEGGMVTITVDLNDMTVEFIAGAVAAEIYIVGQCQGWNIEGDSMPLVETPAGSNIYMGTYTIAAGEFQFRFYSKLGDWNYNSIGSQDDDAPVDISAWMANGSYSGACFYDPDTEKAGKGSWSVPDWAGGDVSMTVNLNDLTVEFTTAE